VRQGARELLDVLTRPDADRAALIGRLHQREDAAWLAELLIDLEEDEPARLRDGLLGLAATAAASTDERCHGVMVRGQSSPRRSPRAAWAEHSAR
jgi:hypothetical protein